MNNINSIINGSLRPWFQNANWGNDYYAPKLRKLHPINEEFTAQYKIDLSIRPFSIKIRYYQKLIDNDIVKYINNIIEETANRSKYLVAYKLNKAKRKIQSLLIYTNDLTERKQFNIALIASENSEFKTDHSHKECTFIFHYMLIALIRCYLEIQTLFIDFIHKEDILTIADIYSQILQKATPKILPIQIIETKENITETPQPTEKEQTFAVQYAQEKYIAFMDAVTPYRFIELPKLNTLNKPAKNHLIKELVENPLSYSIAMLSFLGYLDSLKKTYFLSKEKIYKHIAKALQTDARTVKGNCLVLNPESKEDRYKYQADQFIEKVEEDYNNIFTGKLLK